MTPVLETLADLSPPELDRRDDPELLEIVRLIASHETVYAPAIEMERLMLAEDPFAARGGEIVFEGLVFVRRLAYQAPLIRLTNGVVNLVGLVASGPARAVLWAHAVAKVCAVLETETSGALTLSKLITAYFLEGLPTEAAYRRLWEAQKRPREHRLAHPGSDNWLDFSPEVWNFSREQPGVAASPA